MSQVRIISEKFGINEIVNLRWNNHVDLNTHGRSVEASAALKTPDGTFTLHFVKGGGMSDDGRSITLAYVQDTEGDPLPTCDDFTFEVLPGRPSSGRSERVQATVTPGLFQWLNAERRDKESVSDVVYRVLEAAKHNGSKR